jgi:D-alanine-D-alanine ligase
MSTRVAVIGGGQNCEHEVSLSSAASVAAELDADYDVVRLTIDPDGDWLDAEGHRLGLAAAVALLDTCAVAFPVLHGPRAEDGTVAALCDLAGVRYVGSGVRAGALAMDKWATKLIAEAVGVAITPGVLLDARSAAWYEWTHPVVVKPIASGSSHGVSLVLRAEELAPALKAALSFDDRILVEDVVVGREIDVAVIRDAAGEPTFAPALEILTEGLFSFATKYGGTAAFAVPAALSEPELKGLQSAALAVYDALGCAGVARVDFFLTEAGPVLNEVNTSPGFTEQSQVPKMFAAAGVAYGDLLDLLILDALR